MSQYITIDANDSLSFFMGSWRELHLHEFEFSDSALSSEDGNDGNNNDDSTSTGASSTASPWTNRRKKVIPRSASRNRIPDDWLSLTESPQKPKKPIRTNSTTKVSTPKTKKDTITIGERDSSKSRNNTKIQDDSKKSNEKLSKTFDASSPFQKKPILRSSSYCTDSTHSNNNNNKSSLRKTPLRSTSVNTNTYNNTNTSNHSLLPNKSNSTNTTSTTDSFSDLCTSKTTTTTTNKKDTAKRFLGIIDINPYEGEIISSSSKIKKLTTLLKEHPELCEERYEFQAFPNNKIYPFHMLCAIAAPISCIKRCYKNFPSAINDDSSDIGTAIHYACAFNYNYFRKDNNNNKNSSMGGNTLEIVQYLVKKNANMLRILNKKNLSTALHLACSAPYYKSYRDKDDSSYDSDNDDDDNSTDDAKKFRAEIVSYLTTVCNKLATVVDKEKNTPLHIVCSVDEASIDIIQHLCNVAPQTCVATNKYGATPLHLLVDAADEDGTLHTYVKVLVRTNNTALRIIDSNGEIPLHIAVRAAQSGHYNLKVFKCMLKGYPESIYVKNQNGREAYAYAKALKLNDEILNLLC